MNNGKGEEIKPWAVLGLLFGLCYLCITLDLTGILQGLAKKTADASGSYQTRLFLYIFLFAAVLTVFTNNDISIICLTPLVIQSANSGKMDATPFIFMVLFTSNTFSMLLVTGNPANLIVQQAAGLSYMEYLEYMAAPTVITGLALYVELYLMFRKKLRKRFKPSTDGNWRDLVKLPRYAVFCGVRLFFACIGIPIVGQIQESVPSLQEYPLDMAVVVGIAVLSLLVDLMAFDIRRLAQFSSSDLREHEEPFLGPSSSNKKKRVNMQSLIAIDEQQEEDMTYVELSGMPSVGLSAMASVDPMGSRMQSAVSTVSGQSEQAETRVIHGTFTTFDDNHLLYEKLGLSINTFAWDALWELPWKLIPFVFGLFIIVGFMDKIGLVDFLADTLVDVANNTWTAMFVVGIVATFLCQCVNNQPMTVLLSTVLSRIKEREEPDPEWLTGAYFALAIGANLGGNGTPIASLAVLMWRGILEKWGIFMKYLPFSKRGLGVTPILVLVAVFFVAVEVLFVF